MVAATMKHMASNFAKLDKFEGVDFRRWQKKMHILLFQLISVGMCCDQPHFLTTPIPEDGGDDPTVEQVRKRNKWDNDDYVCRGLILKGSTLWSKAEPPMNIGLSIGESKRLSEDGLFTLRVLATLT
ncbi:hypothetical protein Tco_1213222 [Tanacetum coccineum]